MTTLATAAQLLEFLDSAEYNITMNRNKELIRGNEKISKFGRKKYVAPNIEISEIQTELFLSASTAVVRTNNIYEDWGEEVEYNYDIEF